MGVILDTITDMIYDIVYVHKGQLPNVDFNIKTNMNIQDKLLPMVIPNDSRYSEDIEYISYTGDISEYPSERLELEDSSPFIYLKEVDDRDNVFAQSIFNFRKNGPKFGCDIRLTPYYKIPESFYMDKWGDEIISFTDTLAGYIPLIEKARAVTRNPNLYFGIRIYNNPDSFMLSSLDKMNRIDDNVLISVDNHQYDIAFRKGKY